MQTSGNWIVEYPFHPDESPDDSWPDMDVPLKLLDSPDLRISFHGRHILCRIADFNSELSSCRSPETTRICGPLLLEKTELDNWIVGPNGFREQISQSDLLTIIDSLTVAWQQWQARREFWKSLRPFIPTMAELKSRIQNHYVHRFLDT